MFMSEHDVEVLKRDVQKILSYLHNDEETGIKGLVAEVSSLKKSFNDFIVAYSLEKAFKKGQIAIIGSIGGLVTVVAELIIIFFIK